MLIESHKGHIVLCAMIVKLDVINIELKDNKSQ